MVNVCRFSLFYFSDMFIAAGEFVKAAEILGENGWTEKLVVGLFRISSFLQIIFDLPELVLRHSVCCS